MPGRFIKCSVCNANITKTQDKVQCAVCSVWLHVSCAGISNEELKALQDFESLSYICEKCENNTKAVGDGSLCDEMVQLNNKFEAFTNSIKQSFIDAMADLKNEMSTCMNSMKNDIIDCSKLISQVDKSTSAKISLLEVENNLLHKKLNRADIVIGGIPDGVKCITDTIIELGSFYKVHITLQDINHACFISEKRAVLVKFNSVHIRDEIMRQYFKTIKINPLKVSDLVVDPDIPKEKIDKRVFLNDHYGPAAGKLNTLCRKMLKDKIVVKFKLINADKPRAKLTFSDGKEAEYGAVECAELMNRGVAAVITS